MTSQGSEIGALESFASRVVSTLMPGVLLLAARPNGYFATSETSAPVKRYHVSEKRWCTDTEFCFLDTSLPM